MRTDSQTLESSRMEGKTLESYPWLHERHRLFPEVFKQRNHKKVLDISAGIGVVAKRILEDYECDMYCNEVDLNCLKELKKLNVTISSFDLDNGQKLSFEDEAFDAIVCLATLEHLVDIDFFTKELYRILADDGRLYLSVPNYASLYWLIPILRGRTFHDPFGERSRYEFYAHIRYFTHHTLVKYMEHFGFKVDTVYLPVPKNSSKYQEIRGKSRLLAFMIQTFFRALYVLSPRWHQEPVVCFAKNNYQDKPRKVIL